MTQQNSQERSRSSLPPLTYVFSIYPAVSHTFLSLEVRELRARGFRIHTASVNEPNMGSASFTQEDHADSQNTLYLKRGGAAAFGLRALRIACRHPAEALRGLRAALTFAGPDLRLLGFALAYLAEALALGDWMRHNHSTHLHVHFGGPVASVAFLTAATWGVTWSITIHGPDEFYETQHMRLRTKLHSASFILAISEFTRSQVLTLLPTEHWHKVEVVRLGVKLDRLATIARPPQDDTPRLVCVGRLVAVKAQSLLLDAVAELKSRGLRIQLHLIGDGPERNHLEMQARVSGLGTDVHFHGSLPHAATLTHTAGATVFALPSFAEGLPIALMEAMALGVPVLSTFIAGIPELITNGVTGTLVPAGDSKALASALHSLFTNADNRATMTDAGRNTVAEHFDIDKNIEQLASVLDRRVGA